jgi:hypothetical protein
MIETPLTKTPPLKETISLTNAAELLVYTNNDVVYVVSYIRHARERRRPNLRSRYILTNCKTKQNAMLKNNQNQNNKKKSAAKDKAVNKHLRKSTKKACMLNHQKRDPPNPNRSTSTSINSTQTETPQNPQNCPSAQPHNHSPTATSRQKRCCCCCYRRYLSSPSPSP